MLLAMWKVERAAQIMAVTLTVICLLTEPVIDAASSLILNETIDVQGKKVSMQMLTLQCPLFLHKEGNWAPADETYTFHLIDKRGLPKDVEPRVEANGYYSFKENKWNRFQSIEENRIVLGTETVEEFLQGVDPSVNPSDLLWTTDLHR